MKIFLIIPLLLAAAAAQAQQYSVDWYKICGGGGTSTGNVYSITGTIGQPDASGRLRAAIIPSPAVSGALST